MWVYDQLAFELRRFGADGQHLLSVGNRGDGPGEFSGNACARPGVAGEVWVETETNWHRFDQTGVLLGTFPTPSVLACGVRAWLEDGRYIVGNSQFDRDTETVRNYLVIHEWGDDHFTPTDTIQVPELPESRTVTFVSGRSRSTRAVPFVHNPGWKLAANGLFWAWEGFGQYDIELRDHAGDVLRTIRRDFDPIPIKASVRSQAIADFDRPGWKSEGDLDTSDVPRVYPPFVSVYLAADQSVWIRRQIAESENIWEIFGADGRYLGRPEVPDELAGLTIRHIGPTYLWGILRDEFDVQYVVRVRVNKPKAATTPAG